MNKLMILMVAIAMTFGCSIRPANNFSVETGLFPDQSAERSALPTLMLAAYPRVGFAPLRVSVRAQLQNVHQNDPIFDCLWESWNFGDGSVSAERNDCNAGSTNELQYDQEHVYTKPGDYLVQFVLGDTQAVSNRVTIRVLGIDSK